MRSLLLIGLLALFPFSVSNAAELSIKNETASAILNILVRPANLSEAPFFFRLDLFPDGLDKVENPDISADLRVDTGLQFWIFQNVNLAPLEELIFCSTHPVCMIAVGKDNSKLHINGTVEELAPHKGDKPVCALDKFRPAMTMQEVCKILPEDMQTDDNGAFLTGLGFAGLTWAARLVPTKPSSPEGKSFLDHLELRRELSKANVAKLVDRLFDQNYVPWQAEFPGRDMEFENGPHKTKAEQKAILLAAIDKFMHAHQPVVHKNHKTGEKCDQAVILMAPENMLPALENADEPTSDVQLFTLYLRPCTGTLMLDVAAYRAQTSK